MALALSAPTSVAAVEYRYCVSCDNHRAQALVSSGTPDLGKEWYRVKTAMMFQQAYGSLSCSASDFELTRCGGDPEEKLEYTAVSGDQIEGILSGNPVTITQTFVEVITGIPAAIIDWFKRWL